MYPNYVLFESGCAKWVKLMPDGKLQFHSSKENATAFLKPRAYEVIAGNQELSHYFEKGTLFIQER